MTATSQPSDEPRRPRSNGRRLARAACFVGLVFAAMSTYWGLGGTWLVATVSASLAEQRQAGKANLLVGAWVPALLKLSAAVLPLLVFRQLRSQAWARRVRALAWLEAAVMTTYGGVLTVAGLLVQADVLHRSASADDRALAWHAYLWDPWFLVWGLLVVAALLRDRHPQVTRAQSVSPRPGVLTP